MTADTLALPDTDRWQATQRLLVATVKKHSQYPGSPLQGAYGVDKALEVWARTLGPFIGGEHLPMTDGLIIFATEGITQGLVEVRVDVTTVTRPGPGEDSTTYTLEVGVECESDLPRTAEPFVRLYQPVLTTARPHHTAEGVRAIICPSDQENDIPGHIVLHRFDDSEAGNVPSTYSETAPGDNSDADALGSELALWLASRYHLAIA